MLNIYIYIYMHTTFKDRYFALFSFILLSCYLCIDDAIFLISLTAKKFGVTEFVNPKDHDKPVQEVSSTHHEFCNQSVGMASMNFGGFLISFFSFSFCIFLC